MAPAADKSTSDILDVVSLKLKEDVHSSNHADSACSCILGLGTANPDNLYEMEEFGSRCLEIFGYSDMPAAKVFTSRICKASGISQKYIAATPETYESNPNLLKYDFPTLEERFNIYEPYAINIGKLAAERAICDWGGNRSEITHLISYSTSMLLSPSLDLRLLKCMGLPSTVKHFCVSLLGCHGGVNGLRTAAEIAQADPKNRVLVVFVEINSAAAQPLNPESPFADLSSFLLTLLFGDGAAGVVLGRRPARKESNIFEVHRAQTSVLPDTAACIGAKLTHSGLHTTLAKNVPAVVSQCVGKFVTRLLHDTELDYKTVNWAVHPGGKAIVDAVEKSCDLGTEQLHVSRHILSKYGNMGSTTILFLLDKFREDRRTDSSLHPWTVALSFGPGVTVEGLLLKFSNP